VAPRGRHCIALEPSVSPGNGGGILSAASLLLACCRRFPIGGVDREGSPPWRQRGQRGAKPLSPKCIVCALAERERPQQDVRRWCASLGERNGIARQAPPRHGRSRNGRKDRLRRRRKPRRTAGWPAGGARHTGRAPRLSRGTGSAPARTPGAGGMAARRRAHLGRSRAQDARCQGAATASPTPKQPAKVVDRHRTPPPGTPRRSCIVNERNRFHKRPLGAPVPSNEAIADRPRRAYPRHRNRSPRGIRPWPRNQC
jgi:hypothetical protein